MEKDYMFQGELNLSLEWKQRMVLKGVLQNGFPFFPSEEKKNERNKTRREREHTAANN